MVTEQGLASWTAASGRDWDQLCQAFTWNICASFGNAAGAQSSALIAYYNSALVSTDVWSAPPGAFLYFDIGEYGHVCTRVDNGGDGMASARVLWPWGINAGRTDLADYIAKTGAIPLGWSWDNAGSTYPFESAGGAPTPAPEEDDDMPILELIQTPEGTVWYCVNRVTRYAIPGPQYVDTYKSFISRFGAKGSSTTIIAQANGNAFGTPVFNDGTLISDILGPNTDSTSPDVGAPG